jgi:hypothetical protein
MMRSEMGASKQIVWGSKTPAMMRLTGERDAVRIDSGSPVDHSGPGLTVGPTLPATTGRKPVARLPVFHNTDQSPYEVKERREAAICQPKSGQGCGDSVPASDEREALALSFDDFSISQLREFFELLDRWDREAHGTQTM